MATKATATGTETAIGLDPAVYDESAKRIREFNGKLVENVKTVGRMSLEMYDLALSDLVALERQVASKEQLDWMAALTRVHATFVQDLGTAYTKAARELIG